MLSLKTKLYKSTPCQEHELQATQAAGKRRRDSVSSPVAAQLAAAAVQQALDAAMAAAQTNAASKGIERRDSISDALTAQEAAPHALAA